MGDLLLDIVEYLDSEDIVEGDAIDTFRDFRPHAPDQVVTLQEYAGPGGFSYGEGSVRRFQITARGSTEDPNWGRAKAWEIYNALLFEEGVVDLRPDHDIWGILRRLQTPHKLFNDRNDRAIYGFNVSFTTKSD